MINTDRRRCDGCWISTGRRWSSTGRRWRAVFSHYDTRIAVVNTLKHALVGLKQTQKRAWHLSETTRAIFTNRCAFVTHGERKCADTIGTVPVLWASHFQC